MVPSSRETKGKKMQISYNSSVSVPAGWRSVTITAEVEPISEKRARVVKVIDIDGEGNSGYASRTGAKRQEYNVGYWADKQVGMVKILSKCESV